MANNLIRVKQLDQPELSGLVQNVIESNEFTLTYGGTGININNVGEITISGTDIYLIDSNISGYTGQFQALFVKGEPVLTGSAATASSLFQTGQNLYNYINGLSGDFNETGAFLHNYINGLSGVSVLRYGNQTISGVKTFLDNINFSGTGIFNSLDLNNIDILSLSGVDITITSGAVTLTNPVSAPNLVYNIGDQTVSGVKTFISSGIFSLSGAAPFGLPNNPLSVVGSINSYLQLNIQNRASGTNATADLVITANNGNDSSNFINLGINNSGYNDATFTNGTGYDGYLFINGGNLDIGTQTPNKYIEFHVGGTTANRTIARIDNSGVNIVSGNLKVGNTGVLLSGSIPFVVNFSHIKNNASAGDIRYYFGRGLDLGPVSIGNNEKRRVQMIHDCFLKKISWTMVANTNSPTPSDAITGYFKNFGNNPTTSDNTVGVQVTSGINIPASNIIYSFPNGNLNLPIKSGDYVSFYYQTNFNAGSNNIASGLAANVDAYFYL